jgi:predicted ester cyclase
VDTEREALRDFYRRYMARCNEHRFEELDEFVDADVLINGDTRGFDAYVAGLRAMVAPFPGYRWEPRRLLVDGDWLSAYFTDTGVASTGRAVATQEFAHYRVAGGKIVEVYGVWVAAGTSVLGQLPDA